MDIQNGLIIIENDLGVDMARLYEKSCYYVTRLPEFKDIYDNYKYEVMEHNMKLKQEDVLEIQYWLKTEEDGEYKGRTVDELVHKGESGVIDYLLRFHYCFALSGKIFNYPAKGVW